jgi:hypothetical protein
MTKRTTLKKHEEKTFGAEAIARESIDHPEKFQADVLPTPQTLKAAELFGQKLQEALSEIKPGLISFSNEELKAELASRFERKLKPLIDWYCLKEVRGGSVQYRLSAHVGSTPRVWIIPAHIAERQDLLFINIVGYQKDLLTAAVKDQINAL